MSESISIESLIEDLRNYDWHVRYEAANHLKTLGDMRAVPGLINVLDDDNLTVRFVAAMTLGILQDPRAVPPLIEMLKGTDDHDVLWAAAWALSELGALSSEPLIIVLETEDPLTRDVAADVLGGVGDARAIPALLAALTKHGLKDYPNTGRFGAADALERFGTLAMSAFVQALNHPAPAIRARAAQALGNIGEAGAIPALAAHLRDAEIADIDGKPTLRVCDVAAAALEAIDTPDALNTVNTWREATK